MTHRLTNNCAKNYCNRTLIVKVIADNVVTCFFGTQCMSHHILREMMKIYSEKYGKCLHAQIPWYVQRTYHGICACKHLCVPLSIYDKPLPAKVNQIATRLPRHSQPAAASLPTITAAKSRRIRARIFGKMSLFS